MSTFKSKRRPDAISKTFTLDSHISNSDPHPQYLLRTEVSPDNINIATTFDANSTTLVAASTLTHSLNERLNDHVSNTDIHVTLADKTRWNNMGVDTTLYVTKSELKNVGIYDTAVDNSSATSYNLNSYTTQGVYYIAPTGTGATIVNHPTETMGITDAGFLTVTRTGTKMMQVFYITNAIYKRTATYTNNVWQFDEWRVVLANNPIGSLLLITGPDTPSGYLDADGSEVLKDAYPLLWEYAKTTNYVPKGTTATDADKGKYVEVNDTKFRLPNLGGEFIRMWTVSQSIDTGRSHNSWQNCGVPNITGTIPGEKFNASNNYWSKVTGAFVRDPSATGVENNAGVYGDTDNTNIVFDAKNCSTVYQDNLTEARPRNIAIHVCIKAYHGSILGADADMAQIQAIVKSEIDRYSYATTETNGLVRLATVEQARAGRNTQTVITPAVLSEVSSGIIVPVYTTTTYTAITTTANTAGDSLKKYYTKNGSEYNSVEDGGYKQTTDTSVNSDKDYYTIIPTAVSAGTTVDPNVIYYQRTGSAGSYLYIRQELTSGTVGNNIYTLDAYYVDNPTNDNLSTYYESVVVFKANTTYYEKDPNYGIICTALFDITQNYNNYIDIKLDEYDVDKNDLNSYTVTPMLIAMDSTNQLGYPENSVVTDPQCAVKPNDQYEELGKLDTVLYVQNNIPYVRVYWPLMFYLRSFTNKVGNSFVGAKLFPMYPVSSDATFTTSEFQDNVRNELTKWQLYLKLSKQ